VKVTEVDTQTLSRLDLLADKDVALPVIAGILGVPIDVVEGYLYGSEGEGD